MGTLLRWVVGKPRRDVGEMISTLANCGIRLRGEAAHSAVVSEFAGEPPNYDLLLALVGDVPFDPDTFEELAPYSDDVWHFDYEAIEDHGAYKSIVKSCAQNLVWCSPIR